ncbi:MAG: protein kinase [Planctomycetes bacterium]|nr:protein kinase [Planctomycetota bacterium]
MLEPGSTLGEFCVLDALGEGAMGQVYRARGPGGEIVAVKVIARELASDPSACQRFEIESSILKDLNQPRIVAARSGLERDGERLFYAMEWVDGIDLAALLEREGSLSPQRALSAVADVLEALTYAHARDVLHRDIKASNVLVEGSGRMKLSDFGLARAIDGTRVTRPGSVLGTPAYMAPELAEGGDASVVTEVYAVGVLLHELLAGATPFKGETALAVLHQHINATPPPLEGVSAKVQAIVARALAKRPGERYASATDMRDAVLLARGALEEGEPPAAPSVSPIGELAEAETRELGGASLPRSDPHGAAAFATTLIPGSPVGGESPPEPSSPRPPASGGRSARLVVLPLIVVGIGLALWALPPPSLPASSPTPSATATPSPTATASAREPTPTPGVTRPAARPDPSTSPLASPTAQPRIEVLLRDGGIFQAELIRIDVAGDALVTLHEGAERRDPLANVLSYRLLP